MAGRNDQLWNPAPSVSMRRSRVSGASTTGCTKPCCCGKRLANRTRNTRRNNAAPASLLSVIFSYAFAEPGGSPMEQYTAPPQPFSKRRRNRSHAVVWSVFAPSNKRSANANRGVLIASATARRMWNTRASSGIGLVSGRFSSGRTELSTSPQSITASTAGPVTATPSQGCSANPRRSVFAAAAMNGSSASSGPAVGTGGPDHGAGSSTTCHGPFGTSTAGGAGPGDAPAHASPETRRDAYPVDPARFGSPNEDVASPATATVFGFFKPSAIFVALYTPNVYDFFLLMAASSPIGDAAGSSRRAFASAPRASGVPGDAADASADARFTSVPPEATAACAVATPFDTRVAPSTASAPGMAGSIAAGGGDDARGAPRGPAIALTRPGHRDARDRRTDRDRYLSARTGSFSASCPPFRATSRTRSDPRVSPREGDVRGRRGRVSCNPAGCARALAPRERTTRIRACVEHPTNTRLKRGRDRHERRAFREFFFLMRDLRGLASFR